MVGIIVNLSAIGQMIIGELSILNWLNKDLNLEIKVVEY